MAAGEPVATDTLAAHRGGRISAPFPFLAVVTVVTVVTVMAFMTEALRRWPQLRPTAS